MRSRAGSGSPSTVILSRSVTLTAGEVEHRAVERDAAFGDHRLGVAARGDAGAGDHLGDAVLLRRLASPPSGGGALVAGAAAIGPAVVPAVVGHAGLIAEPRWRGERTADNAGETPLDPMGLALAEARAAAAAARCRSAPSIVKDGAVVAARRQPPPRAQAIRPPMPRCWRSAPPPRRSATSGSSAAIST